MLQFRLETAQVVEKFNAEVVGFKYFSSQSNHGDTAKKRVSGLGERWAYFSGAFCPKRPSYFYKTSVCRDQVAANANASAPLQVGDQMTDCCVVSKGVYAPRGARIFRPEEWRYAERKLARQKDWEETKAAAFRFEACKKSGCEDDAVITSKVVGATALQQALPEHDTLARAIKARLQLSD